MRLFSWVSLALVAAGLVLSGCSSEKKTALDPFAGKGSPYYSKKGAVPWGGGRQHIGKPYQVAGRWFTPKDRAIHGKGLQPDIEVPITDEDREAKRDPQLDRAVEFLLQGK